MSSASKIQQPNNSAKRISLSREHYSFIYQNRLGVELETGTHKQF